MIGKMAPFLAGHAPMEVKDAARPELDVTAARGEALLAALTAARKAVKDANTASGTAFAARDAALNGLRRRLIGLRDELSQLLPDDEPLWYAFGFNRPADPNTAGQPMQLVLTPGAPGSGIAIADWDGARRATSYRPRVQVAGEAKPREYPLVQDTQCALTDLPIGKLLTVTVTAHNDAGDGPASDPATIALG